ncbi:hypothetical protein KOR42_51750 [Thalassoglobus neptunius]|uniref:DUF5060 domain-containing protein n=1 Tax=Thalassoglobus neptunius TaxID=1938619 RepID=A0A5C5VNW1_9PLAN|nr:DUF5060 domain-containing protein [Thalassoglobus neptunius]TWT39797.1 hypothetical protein KOR42_51750 [Thalassoglobus neptunius]
MKERIPRRLIAMLCFVQFIAIQTPEECRAVDVRGTSEAPDTLMRWHRVSLTFDGPETSETAQPNPYYQYRLDVTFEGPNGQQMTVPGFYAADGNAGQTGANSGNKWRAYFSPNQVGEWNWMVSFREGKDVSISAAPQAGKAWAPLDGQSGTFTVVESDKSGRDFRSPEKGLILNRGHHFLTYSNGDVFLKGGPGVPENMLGYYGFDNTTSHNKRGPLYDDIPKSEIYLHRFAGHTQDWEPGDPDWSRNDGPEETRENAGRNFIGMLNYLGRQNGVSSLYIMTMSVEDDGDDTYPTIAHEDKEHYDVSKLDQWEIAFTHAEAVGIFMHLLLCEASNDKYYNSEGLPLGRVRKLFFREMVSRFGHHLAFQLDLGEENDFTYDELKEQAAWIKSIDAYNHPISSHNRGPKLVEMWTALVGDPNFDMTAVQSGLGNQKIYEFVKEWREKSGATGHPLVISGDEIHGTMTDYDKGRVEKMWPWYLSGGGGYEWYLKKPENHDYDQIIDDYRITKTMPKHIGIAVSELTKLPLLEMAPHNELLVDMPNGFCLADPGSVYAIYDQRKGTGFQLNLNDSQGEFTVQWINPREGGDWATGSTSTVTGGSVVDLGNAPDSLKSDWCCIVSRKTK